MLVLGIIMIVISALVLLGSIGVAVIFGPDGTLTTDTEQLQTDSHALVSAAAEIDRGAPIGGSDANADLTVTVESSNEKPVFIGVGRAADVSAYLDGVSAERIEEVSWPGFRFTKVPVPGTREPEPPGEQQFWVSKVEGPGQQKLRWEITTGTYQVVVMNGDASAGIDVRGSLGLKIGWVFWAAIIGIVIGALLLAGGILLTVFGAKRRPLQPGDPGYGVPVGYAPYPGQPGYGQPPYGQPGYQPQPGYAPPPGTTQPPPGTTEPPPGTTQPPPGTTEPPPATTPPPGTTQPPPNETGPLPPPPPPAST
jgi:hypothetical protein